MQKDEFVQAFVKDAIAKVIQPLRSTLLLDRDDLPNETPDAPDEWAAPPVAPPAAPAYRPPPVEIEARLDDSWEGSGRSRRHDDW